MDNYLSANLPHTICTQSSECVDKENLNSLLGLQAIRKASSPKGSGNCSDIALWSKCFKKAGTEGGITIEDGDLFQLFAKRMALPLAQIA